MARNVICLETGTRFRSTVLAGKWCDRNSATVNDACRFGCRAGGYHFYYADEPKPDDSFFENKVRTAVRCVETGETFSSMKAAAKWAGCTGTAISLSIQRGTRAGGHHWEKVNDRKWCVVCISNNEVRGIDLFMDYESAQRFMQGKTGGTGEEDKGLSWQIKSVTMH